MGRELVIDELNRRKGPRRWGDLAAELEISPGHLSEILAGKKDPGPEILDRLGLVKVIEYRKKSA